MPISRDYLTRIKPEDVVDTKTFCVYAHQRLGIPPTKGSEYSILGRDIKEFFQMYPQANYGTLVKVVDFAWSRNARPRNMQNLLLYWKKAYAAGSLPELTPEARRDPELERRLTEAIEMETHPKWLEQLKNALWIHGDDVRREVYQAWMEDRTAAGLKVP